MREPSIPDGTIQIEIALSQKQQQQQHMLDRGAGVACTPLNSGMEPSLLFGSAEQDLVQVLTLPAAQNHASRSADTNSATARRLQQHAELGRDD